MDVSTVVEVTIIAAILGAMFLVCRNKKFVEPFADYITLGSSKKHVLAVLGRPNNVGCYFFKVRWYYKSGSVEFDGERVVNVETYSSSSESDMRFRIDEKSLL